ncbi:PfkB family carbohydrate kinase [Myxococcota bacterium]|nr:PfkB family carbohydrate kinase [Myxococcota bacterium]
MGRLKLAVVGHTEHITLGRVAEVPREGDIAHLARPFAFAGGGAGMAFQQLAKGDHELLLFTAFGDDDAGRFVEDEVRRTGARIFAARRAAPHTRDVVMVTPRGERTIVVVGKPLHPRFDDPLPWHELATCDGVYFTAEDPTLLAVARTARALVVTARRKSALLGAAIRPTVIVGSSRDPREVSARADYRVPPEAVVMTEGAAGGRVEDAEGTRRFSAPQVPEITGTAYGAGDSFAAALTYHVALGLEPVAAAEASAPYGAAVLTAEHPVRGQRALVPPGVA